MEGILLFRALADGSEVGLVVLDVPKGSACVVLYELFLASGERDHGLGTQLIAAVERHVVASGRGCLEVWPRSLDEGSRSDAQLARWYRAHGYTSPQAGSERLRKELRIGSRPSDG